MKPIKKGETKMVHMNESWLSVSIEIEEKDCKELTEHNSQGCFQIGNSCAKKMPKQFILS